jgi:hypothetical protein
VKVSSPAMVIRTVLLSFCNWNSPVRFLQYSELLRLLHYFSNLYLGFIKIFL